MTALKDETETASQEQGDEAEAGGKGATYLSALVSDLPPLELHSPHELCDGRMAGFREIAEALVSDKLIIADRVRFARDEVQQIDWGRFQFLPDDFRCAQRVALEGLDDAVERLEQVTSALLRWLQAFQCTRVVQIEEASWPALRALAVSTLPQVTAGVIGLLVEAAVDHLAKQPNAAQIVAEIEQRRLRALDAKYGRTRDYSTSESWPWVQLDGSVWPENEAQTNSVRREADQVSEPVDSDDSRHEGDSAGGDESISGPEPGQVPLRLQVWGEDDDSPTECLLDLPVVLADAGPAAERRFLRAVTQLAAQEARQFAESIDSRAADLMPSAEVEVPADFNSARVERAREACENILGNLDHCWVVAGVFEDGPNEAEQAALERLIVGPRGTVERVAAAIDELARRMSPPGFQPAQNGRDSTKVIVAPAESRAKTA
jgi:hypothetical protein